jgi:NAD(P)H-hydrate repair Nnr-like enzyme with NAD(P)H-hydrate dehydratase domain
MIGALIAQGHDAWCSTQAAVWLHGRGAEGVGDIGLLADEVAGRAVEALRRLRAGLTG